MGAQHIIANMLSIGDVHPREIGQKHMTNDNQDAGVGEKKGSAAFAYLSPLAVIALSFGYAVGWGSFVLPGTVFLPTAGPLGTIIGFLIGTAAIGVLAVNYHKVTTRIRGSGGAYGFVSKMFGYNHGFLVGWFLFLTYIAILWANATALVLLARFLFDDALQFGFHYSLVGFDVYFGEVLLCLAAIVLCGWLCILSKRFAVRLHTFFAFVLIAGVATCFVAALLRHQGGLAAMGPAFSDDSPKALQILRILAMVPWAFVGFEAVVQSSSEFRFPVKRTFFLLITAILLSALTYILLALLPVLVLTDGYSSWEAYIEALPDLKGLAAMPVFSAAQKALGPLGVAVIGGSMLAGQLTALFATYIAVSRLMRAMADDGMLPEFLRKCNAEGTPVNAVLSVMIFSLPIPFLGRTVIGWPVDLSNLGASVAYGYVSAAALALLRKNRNGSRLAEKAAGFFGLGMSIVFSLLMLLPNYLSGSSLSTESYLLLVVWCFLGFILYRRVFIRDAKGKLGDSTVVWITVLIVIFFSSLMWFRLAVDNSAEIAFGELANRTVTTDMVRESMSHVDADMLSKSVIELCILVAALAIIMNLISILHKREKDLIIEKLKAEESANQSKSYFFSTISHDIRTPLNAIVGYSQMLQMGFKQEEEREQALQSIIVGGKALVRLIDDAIDFSKLEDGRMEFDLKPTDCAGLVSRFMDSFRAANQAQTVELRCRTGEMPTLMIDPKRVRQIIFNLVDNAAKFTQQGFVEVRASFEKNVNAVATTEAGANANAEAGAKEEAGANANTETIAKTEADADTGTLRLEVEDTGCGISKEDLKQIASPYVRVDSKQARHGGTGIGLAVCRKLVDAMGGELSIASEPGKGSTFTVTIPNVKVTDAAPVMDEEPMAGLILNVNAAAANLPTPKPAGLAQTETAKAEKPAGTAATKRILIVDDQKVNLMVLKAMLKKLGAFDIVMAKDGQEALGILNAAETPFALVLTDMWMPVMDGEGLVRAIRSEKKLAAIPVHVVTADTEMQGKYDKIGFDGMQLKPVTVDGLKSIVG